jgi:hypothetical protein
VDSSSAAGSAQPSMGQNNLPKTSSLTGVDTYSGSVSVGMLPTSTMNPNKYFVIWITSNFADQATGLQFTIVQRMPAVIAAAQNGWKIVKPQ